VTISANAAGFFESRARAPAGSPPRNGIERATTLCELRRYREALGLLNRVVQRQPENSTAWRLIAEAHLGRGESAEALDAARTACRLVLDSEPQRFATIALIALGRYEEAAASATEAIRLDPGDWRGYVAHAEALVGLPDRLNEARVSAATAVELAPHEASAHLVSGQIELADGNSEKAADSFRRVLGIDPSNPQAFNELARLQLHGGPRRRRARGKGRRRLFDGRRGT
jgi:Flp pilus assembly protein TadD